MQNRGDGLTDKGTISQNSFGFNRREWILGAASGLCVPAALPVMKAKAATAPKGQWISTRKDAVWQDYSSKLEFGEGWHGNVMVKQDEPAQIIDGFGACFNELGWDALQLLPEDARGAILADFFAPASSPAHGLGFTHCRMPIGANDFSRDWYSYNEVPGDFAMANFSIQRDHSTLIPYIKSARTFQPDLNIWASPWSPPSWMKTNGHYAQRPDPKVNDLPAGKAVEEGQTGFITEERYFKAYALYFRKFIEAYHGQGINIDMVMPQNEFNSNQSFPSCVWKPEMLARFTGFLHDEMQPIGIDIFLGTIERGNPQLVQRFMKDEKAKSAVKGLGFQWAGRHAAPFLHYDYPALKIYQTEQECGDGKNDWRFARHTWEMMKDYMRSGCSVYQYWNMALVKDEPSSWGWKQNSLVVIDRQAGTYEFTPDYYMLKHICHFVQQGAQRVNAHSWTGHENALAFVNTDGSEVMVVGNDQPEAMPIEIGIKGGIAKAVLPPNSINTIQM
ncbi:MAG: glycoside hydrolase family 30 protein [Sphingomonadales bacterium]|nr:glycoside hydrolase family 30 protein [Sphingomonadales bacterium]